MGNDGYSTPRIGLGNDPAKLFLQERYVEDAQGVIPSLDVYRAYTSWIDEQGLKGRLCLREFVLEVKRVLPNVDARRTRHGGGQPKMCLCGIKPVAE
jgi:hypothetical protein